MESRISDLKKEIKSATAEVEKRVKGYLKVMQTPNDELNFTGDIDKWSKAAKSLADEKSESALSEAVKVVQKAAEAVTHAKPEDLKLIDDLKNSVNAAIVKMKVSINTIQARDETGDRFKPISWQGQIYGDAKSEDEAVNRMLSVLNSQHKVFSTAIDKYESKFKKTSGYGTFKMWDVEKERKIDRDEIKREFKKGK